MKIAILLCGHMRSWNECKTYFKETFLKSSHDVDIFVHTYNQVLKYHFYVKQTLDNHTEISISDGQLTNMIALPMKNIVIEDQNDVDPIIMAEYDKHPIENDIYSQYRKFYLCDKLRLDYEKQHNVKYDVVIKTRFDISYSITLDQILASIHDINKIYISSGPSVYPCDQIFVSSGERITDLAEKLVAEKVVDEKYNGHQWVLYNVPDIQLLSNLQTHIIRVKNDTNYTVTDEELCRGLYIDPGYIDWQLKRMQFIVSLYGKEFFRGKNILELGSFEGGITQMFYNLGANIIGFEGSDRNLQICNQRYPHITFHKKDCENLVLDTKYDIIIHWGLLYHLSHDKIPESIVHCLDHTSYLFLETLILDSSGDKALIMQEDNVNLPDQALHGYGCRMTQKYVENILDSVPYFSYERFDTPFLNSRYQPHYDWRVKDTNEIFRRFWIIS